MLPVQVFSHIGICVSDLDRSVRFYRDLLGFVFESELVVEGEPTDSLLRLKGTDLHAVYLKRDGVRIELLHFRQPAAPVKPTRVMHEVGLTHLSFRVHGVEECLTALRAAGERVLEDTVLRFEGIGTVAGFVVDPDGQLIELVRAADDPSAPPSA